MTSIKQTWFIWRCIFHYRYVKYKRSMAAIRVNASLEYHLFIFKENRYRQNNYKPNRSVILIFQMSTIIVHDILRNKETWDNLFVTHSIGLSMWYVYKLLLFERVCMNVWDLFPISKIDWPPCPPYMKAYIFLIMNPLINH